MYEALSLMDKSRLNFDDGSLLILNIAIAIIMFGVALEIKTSHFRELLKQPKPLIIGIISQFILLPLITFLLIMAFGKNLTIGVAMGMILVASCPGGNVSNFMSSLSKGNVALSVSLTAFATIAAIFITPANFALWGKLYSILGPWHDNALIQQLSIDPKKVFQTVLILLGIPITIGMLVNHFLPKITDKIKKPIRIFSIIFFMGMVVAMISSNYVHFKSYIFWIILIVFIHNALAFSTGFGIASLGKLSNMNKRTITIETGIQNSGLGLALLFNPNIFPPELPLGGMMIIVAWWGIWHIFAGLGMAGIFRFKRKQKKIVA